MSAAIYLPVPETLPPVCRRMPVGDDRRIPLDALVDGLLRVAPAVRLATLAAEYVAAHQKPITLRKIVIDPISEEIPLDLDEEISR
jgi:hypothetical protein